MRTTREVIRRLHPASYASRLKVTAGDSGAGHTWSKVRLTWSGAKHPTYTCPTVQSDLRTGKISGIR
ncbi:hypothetical protein [Streptomyces sp. NPDC057460]|uniref:hypothetical protein n=1 Tax=Streptomyces sp. NPDC057460 TaxID=3346141 RepID=UPI003690BF2E